MDPNILYLITGILVLIGAGITLEMVFFVNTMRKKGGKKNKVCT